MKRTRLTDTVTDFAAGGACTSDTPTAIPCCCALSIGKSIPPAIPTLLGAGWVSTDSFNRCPSSSR